MAYHYIDHAATGAGTGTSWADAWTSFASVNWNSFASGDTLWVSGGTYVETVLCKRATGSTEADRSWIKTGAAHPTLSAGHDGFVTLQGFFQLGDNSAGVCNWLTLDGEKDGEINWKIEQSATHGVGARYNNLEGITLRYLEITGNGDANNEHGIATAGCGDDWLIEHCFIHGNYVDCINSSSTGTAFGQRVARNNILMLADDAFQVGGGWDIYDNIIDGSEKVEGPPLNFHPDGIQGVNGYFRIYRNTFKECGQAIFIEVANGVNDMQHIHIYNNLIYSTDGLGGVAILLRTKLPDDGSDHVWDDIKIYNNTISNLNGVGIRFFHSLSGGGEVTIPVGGIEIDNNIINFTTLSIGVDAPFTTSWTAGAWKLRNNIFYQSGGLFSVQFQGTTYTNIATLNALSDADSNINSDPGLTNYASDLTLVSGSPAIGAGRDLSSAFTTDYNNEARSGAWDIGAINYDAAPGDTTPPSPNPSTIASVTVNSATQITIIADTSVDAVSPPVEYNHSIDGAYQGWQSSATKVFTGLTPSTLYSFRVKARDAALNETTQSSASAATTDASATTTPNPLAFRSNAMLAMGAF